MKAIDYGIGPQAEQIKHGEYLAKAGDCIACHINGKKNVLVFAGSLAIKAPFGTIYSPNKETI